MTLRMASAVLWMAALSAQSSQPGDSVKGLESIVRSEGAEAASRVRALSDLQSRNDLDSGVLADALRTAHAVDHPVGFPQGGYLKAVFATVERS